jgi:hypothetical protein
MTANIAGVYLIISTILNNGNFLCWYDCSFGNKILECKLFSKTAF